MIKSINQGTFNTYNLNLKDKQASDNIREVDNDKDKKANTIKVENTVLEKSENPYLKSLNSRKDNLEKELDKLNDSELSPEEKMKQRKVLEEELNKVKEEILEIKKTQAIEKSEKEIEELKKKVEEREKDKPKTEDEIRASEDRIFAYVGSELDIIHRLKAMPKDKEIIRDRVEKVINSKIGKLNQKVKVYKEALVDKENSEKTREKDVENKEDKEEREEKLLIRSIDTKA